MPHDKGPFLAYLVSVGVRSTWVL